MWKPIRQRDSGQHQHLASKQREHVAKVSDSTIVTTQRPAHAIVEARDRRLGVRQPQYNNVCPIPSTSTTDTILCSRIQDLIRLHLRHLRIQKYDFLQSKSLSGE